MTQLIRNLNNLFTHAPKDGVVTIGNFDGVHVGHQALLKKVLAQARFLGVPAIVITFEPQPLELFAPEKKVPRLTRWREKFSLLADYGVDVVVVIRFNAQFAKLSAETFVQRILIDGLQVRHVIVGDDFHFGQGRLGNVAFLRQYTHFTVEDMPSVKLNNARVSSTRVRQALACGDHAQVNQLLGRPYTLQGRVIHGDKLGRQMGFPTVNLALDRTNPPVHGIYTVRMHGVTTKPLPGVASVGTRPTIGGTRCLLEVHLFDFAQEIYGRHVTVEFCEKLRDEQCYPTLDLLTKQIGEDARQARLYFEKRGELEHE